jgi:hypothetical protein
VRAILEHACASSALDSLVRVVRSGLVFMLADELRDLLPARKS